MNDATPLPFDLPAVRAKKLTVDFNGGNQSSDGGLLALRAAEQKIGIVARLATALPDRRDTSRVRHPLREIIGARVLGICCGYEDGIDHDRLRDDPALKMAVGRCPETGAPLASQSTISRFENAPSRTDAARLAAALVDQLTAHVSPCHRDIFDIDDTFDAARHGGAVRCTDAASSSRSGTRTTTSVASRRCMCITPAAGFPSRRSCGRRRRQQARKCAPSSSI